MLKRFKNHMVRLAAIAMIMAFSTGIISEALPSNFGIFDTAATVEADSYKYEYYRACASNIRSIVDGLNSIGEQSSYAKRKEIAALNSIVGYRGSSTDNQRMLSLLKRGKLIKSRTYVDDAWEISAVSSVSVQKGKKITIPVKFRGDGISSVSGRYTSAVSMYITNVNWKQAGIWCSADLVVTGVKEGTTGKVEFQLNGSRTLSKQISVTVTGGTGSSGAIPVNKPITVFSQKDSCWSRVAYGKGPNGKTAYLGESGCGVLALVNATYYLNGRFIQPSTLASWSVSHGYRVNGVGTSYGLYKAFADSCGATYGIRYIASPTSISAARSYLQKGNVCIIGVSGHVMCMVNYDSSTGKYLVLDSYRSSNRGTSSTGYRWMTEKEFTGKMKVSNIRVIGPR